MALCLAEEETTARTQALGRTRRFRGVRRLTEEEHEVQRVIIRI